MVTTNKGALATLDHTSRTMYNFPRAAQPAVMEVDPTAVLARTATPAPPASAKITSAAELWARAPAAPAATRLVVVISAPTASRCARTNASLPTAVFAGPLPTALPVSAKMNGAPAQSANRRFAPAAAGMVTAISALPVTRCTITNAMQRRPTAILARPAPRASPVSAKMIGAPAKSANRRRAPAATRMVTAISALPATRCTINNAMQRLPTAILARTAPRAPPASAKLVGVPAQSANRRRAQVVTCTVVATNALRATG